LSHLDDETIALAALGEDLLATHNDHLARCETCRAEIASLARVATIARSTAATDFLVTPPAAVWARIADETGVDPALLPESSEAGRASRLQRVGEPRREWVGEGKGPAAPAPAPARNGARWAGVLIAASVAGLVVGVGGTLAWQSMRANPAVVASATLAALPDHVGSGEAEVVEISAGRELELTLDAEAPADAFLQVWLLSPDASLMVPVGVLAGTTGQWTLPPGLVLVDYPVVDVSIEPFDGDPTHSADSLVRGVLELSSRTEAAESRR